MNSDLLKSTIVYIYEQIDRFQFKLLLTSRSELTYNTQPFFADINGDLMYAILIWLLF